MGEDQCRRESSSVTAEIGVEDLLVRMLALVLYELNFIELVNLRTTTTNIISNQSYQ